MTDRKIYTSGKSNVLSLPPSWAEKILNDYGGEVTVRVSGDALIVYPSEQYYKLRDLGPVDAPNVETALNIAVAAYYGGADGISLRLKEGDNALASELDGLKRKLYGMDFAHLKEGEITVTYPTTYKRIGDLLQQEYDQYIAMHHLCQRLMERYPLDGEDTERSRKVIQRYGDESDRISSYIKRGLMLFSTDPSKIPRLGLDPADVMPYSAIERNLERSADLEEEVYEEIANLAATYKTFPYSVDMTNFLQLYRMSNELIQQAFIETNQVEDLAWVLRSKLSKERRGQIKSAYEIHEALKTWLESLSEQMYSQLQSGSSKLIQKNSSKLLGSAWRLEKTMWGLVGNASNISESRLYLLALRSLEKKHG